LFERVEEVRGGPLYPDPGLGGRAAERDVPSRLESAEVVESHQVDLAERGPQSRDPPRIVLGLERGPIVERIAPELAGRAEIIRRHPGDELRLAVGVEKE